MQIPAPTVYSVSDLTAYIRALMESNENLISIWVSGEVSNLSQPSSGHMYFTLKDEHASLRCVIWRENARLLRGVLKDGIAMEAHGFVSVYEQGGQYQLYVDDIRAAGEGHLYQEFMRLKAELEAEGLFDEERKRPVPLLPEKIGVVASRTSAAFQDILNTLRSRYPLTEVFLAHATVQGASAPMEIVEAIRTLKNKSYTQLRHHNHRSSAELATRLILHYRISQQMYARPLRPVRQCLQPRIFRS